MATNPSSASDQQIKNLKEAQALGKALGLEYANIADIQRLILDNQVRTKEQLLEQIKLARKAQDDAEDAEQLERNKIKHLQEQKDLAAQLNQIRKNDIRIGREVIDIAENVNKLADTMFTNTSDTYDQQRKLLKAKKQEILEARRNGDISADAARNLMGQLNAQEQQLAALQDIQKEYQNQFDTLSALGGFLTKNFGAVGKTIDSSINAGMSAFVKSIAEGNDKSVAMKDAMHAFGGEMTASITKALGVVGIITMLYDVFKNATEEANAMAAATGITFGQARQIADEARKAQTSFSNQLATQKDILAVQQETIKTFGTTAMLTGEQAANVANLGKSFGYGAEQAAQVNSAFMSMGATATTAYEAQQSLAVEALKAGVNVGAVTQDIAQNAKSTAKYFGGNVQALKDAAIQAAKMGMSLATMSKVSDKLLDVQSSLAAQFEFQALSGRQIDLDLARQLALEGDIAGAAKEVLGAVGSVAEFNSMNMLQRKKLAEATGMEVDELQKSLIIQEKLGDLTDEQKAAMSGLNLSAAELNNLSDEQIRQKLADQQVLEKNAAAFESIKNELINGLLPVAEAFGSVISALSPVLKTIGLIVWGITKPFTLLIDLAKYLGESISSILPSWDEMSIGAKILVGIVKALAIGAVLMGAWSAVGWIPIIGPGLAIGLAAAGITLVNNIVKTGDLAMPAGDGPIVANPREGTIFQGTSNDEVAMGPGVIGMAQQSGGATVVQQSGGTDPALLTGLMNKLDQLIAATKQPTPAVINWGDRDTSTLGNKLKANDSFRTSYNGGYSS